MPYGDDWQLFKKKPEPPKPESPSSPEPAPAADASVAQVQHICPECGHESLSERARKRHARRHIS
jgi:hypothetical protein